MKTQYFCFAVVFLSFIIGACTELPSDKEAATDAGMAKANTTQTSEMIGSWSVASIHQITSDTTYHIDPAQPGLLIVTPERYSMMWTATPSPRVAFKNLSQPTLEEVQAGFRSVVFNAGSYELTDSTITTTAHIAKVPGFEGGKQVYRYEITEEHLLHLTMIDETYPDGTKPAWYGKAEMMFVLERVK